MCTTNKSCHYQIRVIESYQLIFPVYGIIKSGSKHLRSFWMLLMSIIYICTAHHLEGSWLNFLLSIVHGELNHWYSQTHSWRQVISRQPCLGLPCWAPSFLLKRYVLTGIRDGPHEPFIADSVDFVVAQVETLSKDDLASRLSLTVDSASVGPLRLSDTFITIMDTNDFCAVPQELKDQVIERYPGARLANLKSGGDFPFLSRPDEVNLHLQLHLRRVGVEAQPEYVQGTSRDGAGESSSDQNNERGGVDDESKDETRDYIGATNENSGATNENESPLALETPFLGNFDNEILRNVHLSNDE
ncbi:maspardin-like isoform X2 [Salvia splendens]|uniref:maspardin-like isoform X2 n=1 Tax=Salvia splendens TaxID=180675 RepID=UPI001C273AD0|nr:maspardin-like isoform X2 [Salvia splendens]